MRINTKFLNNPKGIVFDFDGVLVDSKPVKYGGWRSVFEDRSLRDKEVLSQVVASRPGDRFLILKKTFEILGGNPEQIPDLVSHYVGRYRKIVEEGMMRRGLFPRIPYTLRKLSKVMPLFINSLTPEDHLLELIKMFGIGDYFRAIYGAPDTKLQNFEKIYKHSGKFASELLFIGDEESDMLAAEKSGVAFFGVADEFNGWNKNNFKYPLISGVAELPEVLGL